MTNTTSSLCPQCHRDLSALLGIEGLESLTFCPHCQFPLALIAGKYKLLQKIGQGGFGAVYLAQHVRLQRDRERVVKLLKPELFKLPGMESRFYREVQVTSSVARNNEHIVRIYDDFGKHPQLGYYYVMEHLEGRPLSELLKPAGTRLPLDLALHIFHQLCDAIDTAHQEQVIHRDLKPDNIFLIKRKSEENFVKVLDFGIAKPLDKTGFEQTQLTHGALGTPLYMAPEQWSNQPIDGRIDIYAMGLLLYQMLTGYLPFPAEQSEMSMQDLVAAHLHFTPRSFAQVAPDVDFPAMLEPIVRKALHKDPADRYPTARAFWRALEGLDHGTMATASRNTAELGGEAPRATVGYDHAAPSQQPTEEPLASSASSLALAETSGELDTALPPPEARATVLPTAESTAPGSTHEPTLAPSAATGSNTSSRGVGWQWIALMGCAVLLGAFVWWSASKNNNSAATTPPSRSYAGRSHAGRRAGRRRAGRSHAGRRAGRRRAIPSPRRRVLRARPRALIRVASRRPVIAPECPQTPAGVRWLYLKLPFYKGLKITHLDGTPRLYGTQKAKGGICVGLTKATSIKLLTSKHFPCYFPVAFRRGTLLIQLQTSSFDAIEPDARYCIQSKP